MPLVTTTTTSTPLPATVTAAITADATAETVAALCADPGTQGLEYTLTLEDRKLRSNRVFDVKQAVAAALPAHDAPEGYVIRSRSKLAGKKLTVTVYYGKPTDAQAAALEDAS